MVLSVGTSSVEVLHKKAQKDEEKQRKKYAATLEQLSAFEVLLDEVYMDLRPRQIDYDVRRDLVRIFNEIAKEIFGFSGDVPVVEVFGSFSMDLFCAKSDLDLSVNFNNRNVELSRQMKIQTLKKLAKKLYTLQMKGYVHGVHAITAARVPVVKVVDGGTDVECDISVGNWDGISKSKIIYMISSIDKRFGKLCFLMKAWAREQNINSAKDQTLNSLSIILLVAFHLQTRNPPILPPFSSLFEDGNEPVAVERSLCKFSNYGISNKESVAELFFSLLNKLMSVERLWSQGLCASTFQGCWISKKWDSGSRVGHINVEDFADRSQNVARAVGIVEVKTIYTCIQHSVQHIFDFVNKKIGRDTLKELLFLGKTIAPQLPACASGENVVTYVESLGGGKRQLLEQPFQSGSLLPKRSRTEDDWLGKQAGGGFLRQEVAVVNRGVMLREGAPPGEGFLRQEVPMVNRGVMGMPPGEGFLRQEVPIGEGFLRQEPHRVWMSREGIYGAPPPPLSFGREVITHPSVIATPTFPSSHIGGSQPPRFPLTYSNLVGKSVHSSANLLPPDPRRF